MNRRVRAAPWGLALGALVLTAGCGADEPEPSDSPSSSAPPRVSEKAICGLLFAGDEKPLNETTKFLDKLENDVDAIDVAEAADLEKRLRSYALRAPETLAPHLEEVADTMADVQTVARAPEQYDELNIDSYRSSGYEIGTVCESLL